jgi:hypothetical protein
MKQLHLTNRLGIHHHLMKVIIQNENNYRNNTISNATDGERGVCPVSYSIRIGAKLKNMRFSVF